MAKVKTITIKTAEEIENMTVENTAIDVALRERFISLRNDIESLEREKKKINEIVLEKYGHKAVKSGEIFKAIVYDSLCIDEDKIIELYGEDALKKVKTKVKHTEYIKA